MKTQLDTSEIIKNHLSVVPKDSEKDLIPLIQKI
jgi:hypothetical protein